ncbi:Phospholipase D1 [Tulasnella sp. 424]|nr:Phospholipase D1 [Tulasnella sp. 424]
MNTTTHVFEQPLTELPDIPLQFGQDGGKLYHYYDQLADELDEDLTKRLKSQLDTLLIFAGLFAGVNSAFLALTLPMMSADPVDDTNALLLQLVKGGNATINSEADLPSASFSPPSAIYPVNVLFAVSLTCALMSSFLAALGQQWLVYYRKRSGGGAEHQRNEQLRRQLGAQRWRLELVLDDILPSLLQVGLVIFCISFVLYLRTLSGAMSTVVATLVGTALAIIVGVAVCATWDRVCPYQSPISHLLCWTVDRMKPLIEAFVWGFIFLKTYFEDVLRSGPQEPDTVVPIQPPEDFKTRSWTSAQDITSRGLARVGRKVETADELKAALLKRVIITSEHTTALIYAATNLCTIDDYESLLQLLNDAEFIDRLHELVSTFCAAQETLPTHLRTMYGVAVKAYSAAILHIALSVGIIADPVPPEYRQQMIMDVGQHTSYIKNEQRNLKSAAKNERQTLPFIASIERIAEQSYGTGENRFGSFAPVRLNVNAQWLADWKRIQRDYLWSLSRAIMSAKERIYIHDWWLFPELYLRRPGQEHYRLDRLLQLKAEQGVKIYVILSKEAWNRTTPADSNNAKRKLMALHPKIMVQRSPAHFSTSTVYWAHHERMCVIDEAIAFIGGLDLCFSRWDTPQHILVDDGNSEDCSNSRAMDFHNLNKPHEDMDDRSKVARMPWHDVGLKLDGQPARDLCRHFVQRWNHLLRTKTDSGVIPFLLPPPDFKITELNDQGLTGTCETQICRSAGPWSLGTATRIEHSIQNAYLKAIELSEHFVYIENQFFITSTLVNNIPVENNIGDALVYRIIRAHRDRTPWRACIVIPLLPGFTLPIDHKDASSIRRIVELQTRSICRGPHSIFSRLRKEGIDPDDYISFFSLRTWEKLENNTLTTEQGYVHGRIMIVDDRVAIIGSANINERSMRGDRDSELACVVRDSDMIQSRMAGKPFKVGRFAHTLRIRLMKDHVGIDTEIMYEADLMATDAEAKPEDVKSWDPDQEQVKGKTEGITTVEHRGTMERYEVLARDVGEQALLGLGDVTAKPVDKGTKQGLPDAAVPSSKHKDDEKRIYGSDESQQPGFASSKVPTLEEKVVAEHLSKKREEREDKPLMDAIDEGQDEIGTDGVSEARVQNVGDLFGAPADAAPSAKEDSRPPSARPAQDESSAAERSAVAARQQLRKRSAVQTGAKPHSQPTPKPEIDQHGFGDPLDSRFWNDLWCDTAVHNTEIYRKVFHCTPDDRVTTWRQYKEFLLFQERHNKPPKDAPPNAPHVDSVPSEGGTAGEEAGGPPNTHLGGEMDPKESVLSDKKEANPIQRSRSLTNDDSLNYLNPPPSAGSRRRSVERGLGPDGRPRRPTNFDEPLEQWERDEFEALLDGVKGNLVVFPTRFLEGEDSANNFMFNLDRLAPMPIFN